MPRRHSKRQDRSVLGNSGGNVYYFREILKLKNTNSITVMKAGKIVFMLYFKLELEKKSIALFFVTKNYCACTECI